MTLSIEQCRKICPAIREASDAEVLEIRDSLYAMARLALDTWATKKNDSSKYPLGSLPSSGVSDMMSEAP